MSSERWYNLPSGLGALLGLILIGEGLVAVVFPISLPDGYRMGVATSLPFIAALIFGGVWMSHTELAKDRYFRVAGWIVLGFSVFIVFIFGITYVSEDLTPFFLVALIRWAGSIGAAVGMVVGIFEARAIDQAVKVAAVRQRRQAIERERDRLDEFAGSISHDLRNPLNFISGNLELAREECATGYLDRILPAIDRMEKIIDDTLELARQGQSIGALETVDLETLAMECWQSMVTFDATIQFEDTMLLEADRDRLRHVFENLFRNSVEHGGRTVTVRIGKLDHENGFYVEDDGPGIPAEDRSSIFAPGHSHSGGGPGLGLTIVQRIVEAHGWDIRVSGDNIDGARFEITGVEVRVYEDTDTGNLSSTTTSVNNPG